MTKIADAFVVSGKTAVVTGAASGIGQAIAVFFAEAGVNIVAADVAEDGLRQTESAIRGMGGRVLCVTTDVSSKPAVINLAQRALDAFGPAHFLINAAGITRKHSAETYPEADWDRVIDVNLKGTFLCCQTFGQTMLEQGEGRIVNIASIGGLIAYPHAVGYLASKGGVVQLTRAFAIEWGARGVTVNAVAPGMTKTAMLEQVLKERPQLMDWFLPRMAIPEPVLPEDIAAAALFLCSPGARFITGHTLPVDAGYLAF